MGPVPFKKPKRIAPTLVSALPSKKKTKRNKSGMAAKLRTLAKGKKPQPGGPRGGLSCRRVPGRMITIEKTKKNQKEKNSGVYGGLLGGGGPGNSIGQKHFKKKLKKQHKAYEKLGGEDANPKLAF